ncbi:MAG TPA: PAS domain S-box protein [Enhygromyxa sp.]|nr:PAS domain S-box protein [Enhygromyxa sp.]
MTEADGWRDRDAALRDPELAFETWRGLFDAVSEAIYVQNREGRLLAVNRAVVAMYGYGLDELLGQSPLMLAALDRVDLDDIHERTRKAFDGEPQTFGGWGRRKDGSEFPKELTVSRARFFGEDVVVTIAHDVSDRLRRELALLASEGRYRAVFEVASDGMLIVDGESGEVRQANRSAGQLFGCPQAALRGQMVTSLLAPAGEDPGGERARKLEQTIDSATADGDAISSLHKWSLRGANGEVRWVDLGFSSIPEGERRRLLVSIHDFTEAKRASDALKVVEERERVAERLRALGELAAGVAHNFNNALTSVLAHTQLLVRSQELPAWAREDLQVIERVARGAAVTVRRIQSFARSRDPEALEPADLADVVANAVALTRPRWNPPEQKKWTLDWTPSEAPLPIVGNAAELCEVVVNLILNGLDAMPEGGVLSVSTGSDGDRVWVEVGDSGVGIDPSSQRKLFDPFFSTKGRQGLGLGLSVSHGIVGRHGGEISVVSEPGKGSTFTVWLPRGEQVPSGESLALGGAPPSTVLLVDDDPTVRTSVAQMLEQLGHEVVTAEEGRAALQRLDERSDIDLLITDLAMPGLDGAGLLREVSRRFPTLPRVLITGLAADAEAGLIKTADAVLPKPIEITTLDHVLARLLAPSSL